MDTRSPSGAEKLEGLLLDSTWYVEKRVRRSVEQSGLARSSCYMATNGQGDHAFIKAYDFRHEDIGGDPEKLEELLAEYLHEKRVHEFCSTLSRVTRVIGSGKVTVDGDAVHYLICEWAPKSLKQSYPPGDSTVPVRERLLSLRKVAAAVSQLHGVGVAHQDIKPSNAVDFSKGIIKITDLGSSSCNHMKPAPHDAYSYCGQPNYAPYELLYNEQAGTWYRRRVGCDLFLVGNLAFTSFVGLSLSYVILHQVPEEMRHTVFGGSYDQILPTLIELHYRWVPFLVEAHLPQSIAADFCTLILQMCHPDPAQRGHPANLSGRGGQYDLERYISAFDLMAKRIEVETRAAA